MLPRAGRSANQKRRDQERFWREHAETVRVLAIGVGAVLIFGLLARKMLG